MPGNPSHRIYTMPLPIPSKIDGIYYASTADQAREVGVKVGDMIESRERYDDGWYEVRITLIKLGQFWTAWISSERDDLQGPWSDPRKTWNWGLSTRKWERTETPPEHTAFMDDLAGRRQAA